jgi:hypothetical protein
VKQVSLLSREPEALLAAPVGGWLDDDGSP